MVRDFVRDPSALASALCAAASTGKVPGTYTQHAAARSLHDDSSLAVPKPALFVQLGTASDDDRRPCHSKHRWPWHSKHAPGISRGCKGRVMMTPCLTRSAASSAHSGSRVPDRSRPTSSLQTARQKNNSGERVLISVTTLGYSTKVRAVHILRRGLPDQSRPTRSLQTATVHYSAQHCNNSTVQVQYCNAPDANSRKTVPHH